MQSIFEKFLIDEPTLSERFSDFKDALSEEEREYVITTDPSGKFKYADWIYKNLIQPARASGLSLSEIRPQPAELKETLSILFNKMKGEMSDINLYETYDELHDATKKLQMEAKSRQFVSAGKLVGAEDMGGMVWPEEVDYKLFHINNRFGARKFYHAPITSWCIATDYPSHYKRETKEGAMMFVVAETNQPRPRDFLALRITSGINGIAGIALDSVWNNGLETNTSADATANHIGRGIFEKEKSKIEEMWTFHYSDANQQYTDYDGGHEGQYSDMIIKRMIMATISGKPWAGMPNFDDDFYNENKTQIDFIFKGNPELFIGYLKYVNDKIEHIAPNTITVPVSSDMMKMHAEKIFDIHGNRNGTNWGEKYFDENNGIGDVIGDWYLDTGSSIKDLIGNLDKANTEHIIALIKSGDKEDIAYDLDDDIDIAESLDINDPHDIAMILRDSERYGYENSAYEWIADEIKSKLTQYTGVKFPDEWTPWNHLPLVATIRIDESSIEDMLSLVGDAYDLISIDPVYSKVHYEIENHNYATIDTERMNNYPDDKDFNLYIKETLPAVPEPVKPKPKKRAPAKKKPIVTADDII